MDKQTEITWHKVADDLSELHFSNTRLTEVVINGRHVCLGLFQDKLYACISKCPHAGGYLKDGYIDATGNIVCPAHRYKFSLENGRNTSGEGYYLKTYMVETRKDGVFIAFRDK